ncbi:hypothetical protein [Streptomyces sp. NPDC005498]|uniref:hypothetical protein n=1 Tax=Streptomyces sp. NPDC005498 TaxID=3364717 RepID=UPI0036C7994C
MAQLETSLWDEVRLPLNHAGPDAVNGAGGTLTRATMLVGALVSATVGGMLITTDADMVAAVGTLLAVQIAVQGVLQLLAVYGSKASRTVRRLLFAAGLTALVLSAALVYSRADPVFLLGVWTGCGWLLRGLTMAVSVTSPSVSHIFVYDELLNAVIVSAGLFMTAFPFSSLGQLADAGGVALMVIGVCETVAAAMRHPRTLRALD